MTAQIRGLAMAVKNSNDSMSLAQTAEGAMEEVTNMLQRIRELAVQSANGTMNASDRSSLDAEVQALKAEIDRVAGTTQFNSQNLLDGSYKATFQIGDKAGQTVGLKIGSVQTKDLGMGASAAGGESLVGARYSSPAAEIAAGDIKINGQDVGKIAASADMEKALEAINNNVDNVEATAFNVVVAKMKGNGVTAQDEFQIEVTELGVGTASTFNISASSSMEELVANINAEAGGVVDASINDEGKLVLSNSTGATIKVTDDSATSTATYDGGSGFGGSTQESFAGFIKLTSLDGTPVRIEQGNKALADAGTVAGVQAGFDDLEKLGFRETMGGVTLDDVRLDDAYTVFGKTLTAPGTEWGKGDLVINGVEIFDSNVKTDTAAKKVEAINNFAQETGVTASLSHRLVFNFSAKYASTNTSTDTFVINGSHATVGTSIDNLVSNINALTATTGVTAEEVGTNLVLHASGLSQIVIEEQNNSNTATNTEDKVTDGTYQAQIRLDSSANSPISIELGDSSAVGEHGFLQANVGAADFEVNEATMGGGAGASMEGLSVATENGANNAITTLDNAINRVNEIRGDLGALQNRLDYTINNLSSISNSTAAARGRIVDADFAMETSELTKHQILTQAATSMLAQANQSKQGILALLQG
jgi:flagellin